MEHFTPYGLLAALALLLTLAAAALYARKNGVRPGVWPRLTVIAVPLCWLFSRLVFVLSNLPYYLTTLGNPALALNFWDGGYSVTGAMMGLLLAARLAEKWLHAPRSLLLDGVGFAAPLGLCVLRLAEGGSRLGLGRPITYEWLYFLGVQDGYGDLVHPVYLYEAACAALIFAILLIWLLRRATPAPKGDVCLVSLTLMGAFQVILESLRNDGHMVIHFVRVQQVLSLIAIVVAFAVFTGRLTRRGGMKKSRQLLLWLLCIVCIAVGIVMEFRVDRGALKLVYYAVMGLCIWGIAAMGLVCRHKAERIG